MKTIIANNLNRVRARLNSAADRAGRDAKDIALVAVTKYVTPEIAAILPQLGMYDLGENRVQKLLEKKDLLPPEVKWHLIGNLQRNKARKAIQCSSLIHAADSTKLIDFLASTSQELGVITPILLEVNVSGEESKHGFDSETVFEGISRALDTPHLEVRGLMTMAPFSENPEDSRPTFVALRELRDKIIQTMAPGEAFRELSMGMSGDFEVAIEEGATILRVGSLFFEGIL